jgi:hypothetical protein
MWLAPGPAIAPGGPSLWTFLPKADFTGGAHAHPGAATRTPRPEVRPVVSAKDQPTRHHDAVEQWTTEMDIRTES